MVSKLMWYGNNITHSYYETPFKTSIKHVLCICSNPGILRIADFQAVQDAVWPARSKYYNLGIALGVSADDLDATEKSQSYRVDECFGDMLKKCLRRDEGLSQRKLARALANETVGYGNLGKKILEMTFL